MPGSVAIGRPGVGSSARGPGGLRFYFTGGFRFYFPGGLRFYFTGGFRFYFTGGFRFYATGGFRILFPRRLSILISPGDFLCVLPRRFSILLPQAAYFNFPRRLIYFPRKLIFIASCCFRFYWTRRLSYLFPLSALIFHRRLSTVPRRLSIFLLRFRRSALCFSSATPHLQQPLGFVSSPFCRWFPSHGAAG